MGQEGVFEGVWGVLDGPGRGVQLGSFWVGLGSFWGPFGVIPGCCLGGSWMCWVMLEGVLDSLDWVWWFLGGSGGGFGGFSDAVSGFCL